jgi:hypothetical protein
MVKWSMCTSGTANKWHAVREDGRAVCRKMAVLYNRGLVNIPEDYKCKLCVARLQAV